MIEEEWPDKVSKMLELKAAAKALGVENEIQPIVDKIHDDMHRECRDASVEPMSMYFMTTELCKRIGVHPADFMHFCKQIIRHIDTKPNEATFEVV
jgi:hypothetical protein